MDNAPILKTNRELKTLALDMLVGKVFSNLNCANMDELESVFVWLKALTPEAHKVFQAKGAKLFYEYVKLSKGSLPNGKPVFLTMQYLLPEEFARYEELYEELVAAIDSVTVANDRSIPSIRPLAAPKFWMP